MQEEETAVMRTKRPMEDEETEAKRPRVEDVPENSKNSDIDMDEELNKLMMQNWNFTDEQKIDNRSCENLMNESQMQ